MAGRTVEGTGVHQGGHMTEPSVEAVLAGFASYDDLDEAGQALVRAAWETRDSIRLAALNFTLMCPDCGLQYAVSSPGCRGHGPRT